MTTVFDKIAISDSPEVAGSLQAALAKVKLIEAERNTSQDSTALVKQIKKALVAQDAVLVAHYYTAPEIQALAEATGGCVADSLEMARFGRDHTATTLVVAGVRFMGETAKILSPNKRILMPTLEAECSLDLSCPVESFCEFKAQYPDRTVVVYANTSAAVKAEADWVVTSSIAVPLIEHLAAQDQKVLWAPDRYLGRYVQQQTQADMVLWQGACVVHEEFKAEGIQSLLKIYPGAGVLVHPESPEAVIQFADVVGSTSQLIQATAELPHSEFIVATDTGIFYKMQQACPDKRLIAAPTAGEGGTCRSCAHCPWMALNQLQNLYSSLVELPVEIKMPQSIIDQARIPLERMIHFSA